MTHELQSKIERLEAQVAALADERLPRVDRASKRRDRRQVLGGFGMFAVALLMAGTLSASALAGSNTVTSDDIVDDGIYHTDIRDSTITGGDVRNNSLTGVDIDEAAIPGFKNAYIAKVNLDGVLASGDATSSLRHNPGLYYVYFPATAKITYQCAAVATVRTQYSPTGYATTTVNTNYVDVRVTANAVNADRPFDLVVVCP